MADTPPDITWQMLLNAYRRGYFPMAMHHEDEELHWFYPEHRGILPLDAFHVPRSLAKCLRKSPFTLTTNRAFAQVVAACGEICESRRDTWINRPIRTLYTQLWQNGFAHSVECWLKKPSADGTALSTAPCESQQARSGGEYELVGGLYGVALGGAFFGESMFSRTSNASRAALVHLVQLLRAGGYTLLDTQFTNEHLKQFGAVDIPRAEYLRKLEAALSVAVQEVFDSDRIPNP
jgi:leucyl/phenylalanyl-tRNA--protein transferase